MEHGESPVEATIREIKEELGCRLDAGKLSYLKPYFEKDLAIIAHIFHYPVTYELDQAVLMEGQTFQFMALADLAGRKVIPLHLAILEWYFQEHQKTS